MPNVLAVQAKMHIPRGNRDPGTISSAGADHLPPSSGVAIFWALASLALSAVIQPSFCGHVLGVDGLNATLWPHRSSPFVCLVDAIADVCIIVHKRRTPERYSQRKGIERPPTGSTTVVMKMVLLVVGVLPQAIKLFSMRGVPISQAIGAAFVVSIIVNTIRSLASDTPVADLTTFGESLPARLDSQDISALICVFAFLPHVAAAWATWSRIDTAIAVDVSDPVADALEYLAFGVNMLWILHGTQHTLSIVVRGQWTIPRLPVLIMMGSLNIASFPRLLARSASEQRSASPIKNYFLVANVGVWCLALSWLIFAGARVIARYTAVGSESTAVLPTTRQKATAGDATNLPPRQDLDAEGDLGLARLPQAGSEILSGPILPSLIYHPLSPLPKTAQKPPPSSRPTSWPWTSATPHFIRAHADWATLGDHSFASLSCATHRSPLQRFKDRACLCLLLALQATLHALGILVWRLVLGFSTFYGYGWEWTAHHLQSAQNREVVCLAFGIFNALTAACYYLAAFDGAGTSAPGWAGMLG